MSYDLFLDVTEHFSEKDYHDYFSSRRHYTVKDNIAAYENRDTGVYFSFFYQEDTQLHFNLNYNRPCFFALEACEELKSFLLRYKSMVVDSQNGMSTFDSVQFIESWKQGNLAACELLVKSRNDAFPLNRQGLNDAWSWNLGRIDLAFEIQQDLLDLFVPKIVALQYGGQMMRSIIWIDAIPARLPMVDACLFVRKQLLPTGSPSAKDYVVVLWNDLLPFLSAYDETSFEIKDEQKMSDWLASLPPNKATLNIVPWDKVLEEDIVERVV